MANNRHVFMKISNEQFAKEIHGRFDIIEKKLDLALDIQKVQAEKIGTLSKLIFGCYGFSMAVLSFLIYSLIK